MNFVSGDKLVAVSVAVWSTEEVICPLTQDSNIASQPWLNKVSLTRQIRVSYRCLV